ncbi:GLTSCR1-like protein-like [Scleropages formosus]|uniref:GLTSCR1-like protein-like n=1 Tax=Scleropages formosus TaxID=113540 RepID=A0A0P7Z2M8_SCLFO|nr:GLTSCR1-like protein-like [Scleropages formosus]
MDDEDDRRLLDIIGDVQALNDYLHGSSNKSINEDDVTNATFGSASFFTSNTDDPISILNDGTNHLGDMEGAVLQLPSSLQFIEEELGGASPSGMELGEEQPFDILQKSLQEADITEQTLAQEALLEATPSSLSFPPQLVSGGTEVSQLPVLQTQGCAQFPGVQNQGFIRQIPPPPLQNGSSGHIQLLGSFNGPTPMMTINSIERPQILLRPGEAASPGLGGGVLMQRPTCTSGATQASMFNPTAGGQMSMPFKGSRTPIPLQNIIIQRGTSPQMFVKPIQPKPLQVGGQAVYNISSLSLQPQSVTPTNSGQAPQQMTVNVVNQTGLHKIASGPQVPNHSNSIMIHSALGEQQQQMNMLSGQYLCPSSLNITPGTTTHGVQTLNGQVLQAQVQGTADQTFVTRSATSTYSGAFLTNQGTAVQLIAGQNFATAGHLVVNQGIMSGQIGQTSPSAVQVSQSAAKPPPTFVTSTPLGPNPVPDAQIQARYTVVNSVDSSHIGYTAQLQGAKGGGAAGLQNLQQRQHIAAARQPDTSHLGAQGLLQLQLQPETQLSLQSQLTTLKRPAPQQLTKGGMILQQLRRDQARALVSDRSPFSSFGDAVQRLLPYHVFQGVLPSSNDLRKVDVEFEEVASQVLKRTQSMLNKYQRLLLVEAERPCLSSEIVMIDRTFNQEERRCLTQEKRLALVDPEGYLEDFCCPPKPRQTVWRQEQLGGPAETTHTASSTHLSEDHPDVSRGECGHDDASCKGSGEDRVAKIHLDPSSRTDPQLGCKDPNSEAGVSINTHLETAIKSILDPKKTQRCSLSVVVNRNSDGSPHPTQTPHLNAQSLLKPHAAEPKHEAVADTDSVLEAAVNSILEC